MMPRERHEERRVGRASWGGTLLQLAAALIVTIPLFGILEIACTIYLRYHRSLPLPLNPGADAVESLLRFTPNNLSPVVQDVDLLWRNEPSASRTELVNPQPLGRNDTWHIAINSEGFRGPERWRGKTVRDVYRILCIGDSVTFGYNVDQEATFPRRLQDMFRQRYPGVPIEVINAGVPGWTWVQGLHFLEREGLALHPTLVIAAFGTNDQFWLARVTDAEHIWLLTNPLLRFVQAVDARLERTATYRALVQAEPPPPARSPACAAQIRAHHVCHRVSPEEIEGAIDDMRHMTSDAGVDLVVMNADFYETGAVASVSHAALRNQLPFLNHVAQYKQLLLMNQLQSARQLGLAPPHVPTVRLRATDATQPPRPQQLVLRVRVARPGVSVSVRGTTGLRDDTFDEPMYDDGTHGDEIVGDRVFSTTLEIPDNARAVRYRYYLDGNAEFEPANPYPPYWANRLLHLADDSLGLIDVFGERFLMAENVHPNADGQAVIATSIAAALAQVPSFRQFVER